MRRTNGTLYNLGRRGSSLRSAAQLRRVRDPSARQADGHSRSLRSDVDASPSNTHRNAESGLAKIHSPERTELEAFPDSESHQPARLWQIGPPWQRSRPVPRFADGTPNLAAALWLAWAGDWSHAPSPQRTRCLRSPFRDHASCPRGAGLRRSSFAARRLASGGSRCCLGCKPASGS